MVSERVAVITGGAGAIGSAIGDALRADGMRVVVVDRAGDITADLSSESSARAAAAAVIERYGRCDVFVHCAAHSTKPTSPISMLPRGATCRQSMSSPPFGWRKPLYPE